MWNRQRVKHFRGEPLMSERGQMNSVTIPETGVAKFGEAPEVDQLNAEIVDDGAEKFVVDRGASTQSAEQWHGAEIGRGEGHHVGAGLLQGLEGVGVPGHHRVDVVAY